MKKKKKKIEEYRRSRVDTPIWPISSRRVFNFYSLLNWQFIDELKATDNISTYICIYLFKHGNCVDTLAKRDVQLVVLLYMSLTRNYNMHAYMKNDQLGKCDKI